MKNFKKNIRDWGATLLAILVAIAIDWQAIDWENFNFKKEWMKLFFSAIIVIGGYVSKIKSKKDDSGKDS